MLPGRNNIFIKTVLGKIPSYYDDPDSYDEYNEDEDPYKEDLVQHSIDEDSFDPFTILNLKE